MRDLDCWDALADAERPEDELVDWLERLAERPLSERWPWLARVAPHLASESPALRVAALHAADGAVGFRAREAIVAALDDEREDVRGAALRALAAVGRADGHQWVHAVFHRRDDVRLAALAALPGHVDLPQWVLLPLLGDPVCASAVEARLLERGLVPESVAYLLRLMQPQSPGVGRGLALRCLANLDWRHQLEPVLSAIVTHRRGGPGRGTPLAERLAVWAEQVDSLDLLVSTVLDGVAHDDEHAIAVLDRWLRDLAVGGSVTDPERRLAASLLVQPDPLPPAAIAIGLLAFPELLGTLEPGVLWTALPVYARAVGAGPVGHGPRGFVERFPIPDLDVDGLAGLVRLVGDGALHALTRHPDVDRGALVETLAADPASAARLLAVPLRLRRDLSARRQLIVDVLAAHGPAAGPLIAHAAVALPHSQLGVLEARPDDIDEPALLERVVLTLVALDAGERVRDRRVRQLAELEWLQTVEVLAIVLAAGASGRLVHRLVTRILQERGAGVVTELPGPALERLVELDRYEDALPWAIQQEVARVLQSHGHTGIQGWASAALAPVEVAMSRMAESSPGRRLTDAEVARIKSATAAQLPAALAPALSGRVRGLVEALGERRAVPSVEACLALLLSADRLESVARLVEDYADDEPGFWNTLEERAVANFAHDDQVGIGLAIWLWRWDRPFEVFVRWATEQTDDLALVLQRSLGVPSARMRQRLWQAGKHLCGRWRWRAPATLVRAATNRLQSTVMGVFSGASTLDAGRSPRAWIASEQDYAEVTRLAAAMVDAMHRLSVDLSAHREAVEACLGELPPRTVAGLAGWLGMPAPEAEPSPEPASAEVPRGVEALTDPADLVQIVMKADRGYAELAALRLLELGPEGQRALADAMAVSPGRNPGVTCEAAALLTDPDAVATLARVLADAARPAIVRFHVALAVAEGGQLPDVDAVRVAAGAMALPLGDEERPWLDSARFARWYAHLPDDPADFARWLVDSPHFPAYHWAVGRLVELADADEVEPLERFLRHGTTRAAKVRWQAAEALAVRGRSLGAPLLAARRVDQVRNHVAPLVELAPRRVGELTRAALLAGSGAVDPRAWLEAATATHIPEVERTSAALAVVRECEDEGVQREALNHLDNRATRERMVGRLARIVVWGRDQARDLLDRDFGVQLIGGEALGYTRLEQDKVFVNPLPLLRGERNGGAVLRGLLVHELGHHLYNADEQGLEVWKRAADEGLQRLHNLVCDEHLERNLRAMKPSYDTVLKRLAAWAFLHTRTDVAALMLVDRMGTAVGRLIGAELGVARRARLVSVDMGRLFRQLEAEGSSFARFVRALRMGLGNRHGDPLVVKALALFGSRFRHLDNEGLYEVTLAVRDLFGQDIGLMDVVDLHGTTTGGDGEAIEGGRGVSDAEVQDRADDLVRIRERPQGSKGSGGKGGGPDVINVGSDQEFAAIEKIQVLAHDPTDHARLARDVARPANQLRHSLVDLGLSYRTVKPRTRGHRIDRGRLVSAALRRDPRILVSRVRVPANDLFVGVVVDCSGSMNGERMERARMFATLIAAACQGLPSVDVRIFGFTDQVLYDAGTASRCAAHALVAGGGNNDAAALHHVAGLARRSPRDAKLLVMISDGLPTECTSTSLIALVRRLEREGMACAQVAVASIREPCFDHYVEVLGSDTGDVVRRFGRIVQNLVAATLRGSR